MITAILVAIILAQLLVRGWAIQHGYCRLPRY